MRRSFSRLVTVAAILLATAAWSETVLAQAHFTAVMTAQQEVPPNATTGKGTAAATLTSGGLFFHVTVDGLSGPITAAHFHSGLAGVNGGVVRTITADFSGGTAQGLWTSADAEPLTAARIAELLANGIYVNVHTAANPGGELRGQLQLSSGLAFTSNLSGAQENPVVPGAQSGTGSLILTPEGIQYNITMSGLSGAITAAHIHTGGIGANGGVITALAFAGNHALGTLPPGTLSAAQIRDLVAGNLYFNVHTAANPGGEARGQLHLAGGFGARALMNAANEVPPNGSPGIGVGAFTLTSAGLQFDITATNLTGAITSAHFHRAPSGVNGGVVRTITAEFGGGLTASGLWRSDDAEPLTPALINDLLLGNIYVNLHTAANPGGEIRGQVLVGASGATYVANLTGSQEEPPVGVAATGTAVCRLTAAGLEFALIVNGLSGAPTAMHFHNAGIGANGGVMRTIAFVGGTASGIWAPGDPQPFTAAMVTALLNGQLYFNVHTALNPGGEVRGQILPASGAEFASRLSAPQEVPPNPATALGVASFTYSPEGLAYYITVDGLSGAITAAHIHSGAPGVGGAVVRTLAFVGGTSSGVWKPSDPQPLTAALVGSLMSGNLYLNIHTALNPGGEIRGQILPSGGLGENAALYGGAEVPPTPSTATGTLATTLRDAGLIFNATATKLSGPITAAHFHNAAPGVNGGVVRDVLPEFTGNTASGNWSPTDAMPLTATLAGQVVLGNIYMNLHTALYPGGEIRGQLGSRTAADVDPLTDATLFELSTAPNPFSGRTTLSFFLPTDERVRVRIFDLNGREVAVPLDGPRSAGWNSLDVSLPGFPEGVYFYRVETAERQESEKLLLIH